jgi:peroxiredoxin
MVLMHTPVCDFDQPAPDFSLLDVSGKTLSRDDCKGENGLLVMFICNHCPFVRAIRDRLVRDVLAIQALGIGVVAIMSNDPTDYQEDSYENMQQVARDFDFPFPYLFDETQQVAQAYGAICTPDFFGYNADLGLQYRGRLDESGKQPGPSDAKRELLEAMQQIAKTGRGPEDQTPSMGCSIKWADN